MWLSKEEWKKFDELFSKIGFGGYYDFLEMLKLIALNLSKRLLDSEKKEIWKKTINDEKDLKTLIHLINYLSYYTIKKEE